MFSKIEIVVARYNEDLSWTKEYPFNQFKYTIYNKGSNDNFTKPSLYREFQLPNVGKCDHTYLYHIVNNYNTLSPITIFLPGSLKIHYKKAVAVKLINHILSCNNAVFLGFETKSIKDAFKKFCLDNWSPTSNINKIGNNNSDLQKALLRPYGKWYNHFFNPLKNKFNMYSLKYFSFHTNSIQQKTSKLLKRKKRIDILSIPKEYNIFKDSDPIENVV